MKSRRCELCGLAEEWRGRRMALILDHVNGVPTDNRIENLRIVFLLIWQRLTPTVAKEQARKRTAILPPLCQKVHAQISEPEILLPDLWRSQQASTRAEAETRKVPRPSYDQLKADLETMSFCAVGRKYGVSDNAIRKWLHWERDARARTEALRTQDPPPATMRRVTAPVVVILAAGQGTRMRSATPKLAAPALRAAADRLAGRRARARPGAEPWSSSIGPERRLGRALGGRRVRSPSRSARAGRPTRSPPPRTSHRAGDASSIVLTATCR